MTVETIQKIAGSCLLLSVLLASVTVQAEPRGERLAQNGKAKKAEADTGKSSGDKGGGRKKFLSSEARTKGTKTNIDFDAAAIDGERRIPAGVAIGGAKQDHEYDLINLRLRWHPEMIKSTSNLETGKGQ